MTETVDNKPYATPLFRRRMLGRRDAGGTFTPVQVAKRYGLPKVTLNPGQKTPIIGIVELAGGYVLSDFALAARVGNYPTPTVNFIGISGATNQPGDDADAEVALDGQIPAAIWSYCTGVPASLLYCFAPNTLAAFAQAVVALIQAGCSTISISWGGIEDPHEEGMEQALRLAINNGVSVFSASGDNLSGDGGSGTNTDYPASSPNGTGVGGTNLTSTRETVWNDGMGHGTGGGYSKSFAKPTYQTISGTARGVPDVAALADPQTGWDIYLNGQIQTMGGTSCAAPCWAGVVAVVNALRATKGLSPVGFFNPFVYANADAFNDILIGNNGAYQAGPGWDACTGMGTPNGPVLFNKLGGVPVVNPPPVVPPPIVPPPVTPTFNPTEVQVDATIDVVMNSAVKQLWMYPPFANYVHQVQVAVKKQVHSLYSPKGAKMEDYHAEKLQALATAHGLTLDQILQLIESILSVVRPILNQLPTTPTVGTGS